MVRRVRTISLADPGATDAASLACMPDAFCVQWHRPQLCESDMPSRAGFWTIFGLAVATVDVDTMDCSSYYCGEISS